MNRLAPCSAFSPPMDVVIELTTAYGYISFIRFCLDGDSPGRKAAAELMEKYYGLGYEIEDCPPPAGYKDYNEWLVATKLNLADEKKEQMTIAGQCH